jgi:tetratricopeptide (TPR) repeat protein
VDTTDIVQLRQAVQTAPQDRDARLALLQVLVTLEAWQEAREVGAPLLQDTSPPPAVHALMSLVYAGCTQVDEALQQGREAHAQQPDDALLPFNLGTILARQGNLEAALEWLEKAVRQHEAWPEAQFNLGTALLRLRRYHEALEAFERAVEQRDIYPEAHFGRGNAHALLGLDPDGNLDYYELDCAINAYKAAIQQRPGYTAALYNLGLVYGRLTSSEGLRVWDQYLEAARHRSDEEPWNLRAQEYRRDLQDRLS